LKGVKLSIKVERALISVSDKKGIVDFAKGLDSLNIEIISTGGTYQTLKREDIHVLKVEEVTAFPEMLDGRVKTLHPFIHAGILADRKEQAHMNKIKEMNIPRIDMVVVNLYPFKETVLKKDVSLKEAIENIDIGGPTMIRSAAKNHSGVAVIVDPGDYLAILENLKQNGSVLQEDILFTLSLKAFRHTAEYDSVIFNYFIDKNDSIGTQKIEVKKFLEIENTENDFFANSFKDNDANYIDKINIRLIKKQNLRYGENPHQKAACYRYTNSSENTFSNALQLQGKELSYNNFLDGNAAFNIVKEFKDPCVAIIKHNNPCGAAISDSVLKSYDLAQSSDPLSAFGGVIACNSQWTKKATELLMDKYVEVLIAPEFEDDALLMLKEKENLRVLKVAFDASEHIKKITRKDFKPEIIDIKSIDGGLLIQDYDEGIDNDKDMKVVTTRNPNENEWQDLLFGWQIVKNVKSNAIVIIKDKMTVGVGAGQMSRVDAVKISIEKSLSRCYGSSMASDAFFPFEDAIEIAANNNIKAIIQPGGSVRDKEIIDACNNFNIAMVFTGKRHFKH
jgi:phosphoribosylaminoimidazolecarboxamide formyltransferase / IMP cyclohydrolase